MMRPPSFGACAVRLLFCLPLGILAITAEEPPRLVCPTPTYDFGEIVAGELVRVEFPICNEGGRPLTIARVGTACGCLAESLVYPERLAPDQTGAITAVINTLDFRGTVRKPFTIFCDDPASPRASLWIAGTVTRIVEVEPRSIDFGDLAIAGPNAVRSLDLRVSGPLDPPLILTPDPAPTPPFQAVLQEVEPRQHWRLQVTWTPPVGVGLATATYRLATNHPRLPQLVIELSGFVRPPVQVIPPQLLVGRPLDRPVTRRLTIRFDEPGGRLLRASTTEAGVILTPSGEATDAGIQVLVTIPPHYQPSPQARIDLTVSLQETQHDLVVPVVGIGSDP
jgi:hypothetical protein